MYNACPPQPFQAAARCDRRLRRGTRERRVAPEDARARLIHLTRRGKALRTKLVPVAEEIVERMTRGIDARALDTTRETLRRMFQILSE